MSGVAPKDKFGYDLQEVILINLPRNTEGGEDNDKNNPGNLTSKQ